MTRVLAVLAALAVIGAGCGAAENEPNLASAVDQTQAAGSSRFAISGTASDGSQKVEIACIGEAEYHAARFRLTCDYGSETMELLAIGATTYVRGDLYGFGGSGDKWARFTDDETLGHEFSPQALLAMLRDASRSTERIGEEPVRGADTVRYRLVVECEQAELMDCDGATAPVDVWIGDDGVVRRIAVEQGSSPFTVDFYDFGADVDIEPPSPGDVQSVDGLFGSVTCASGFGSPIALEQATGALRRHAFSISVDPVCSTESASFENDPAAHADQGHVYCVVRATAPEGAPTRVQPLGTGVTSMALRLQNVECTLVADIDSEAKLARLKAALTELAR